MRCIIPNWPVGLRRAVLLSLAIAGCAPVAGGGALLGSLVVLAATVILSVLPGRASAAPPVSEPATAPSAPPAGRLTPAAPPAPARGPEGGPPPIRTCSGSWHTSCVQGRLHKDCCPKGARCNYAYAPYVDCGYGECAPGKDPAACAPRQPVVVAGKTDAADCRAVGGTWERACVASKPVMACIAPVPTNYTGPPPNPPFSECGDRCSTTGLRAACWPTRAELGKTPCKGTWRKTCVGARIAERCLPRPPTNYRGVFYPSTQFTECGADRCLPGTGRKDECR